MKRILVAGLSVIAAFTFAFGQTDSRGSAQNAKVEQEIKKLERDWFDSYVNGDRAAFDRLVADDIVITYGSGKVGNKAQAIAEIKAPADKSYSLTSNDVQVRIYGEDTAVVTGIVSEKGTFNGQNLDSQSRYTDVWVRRNGRWQVVAAQNTRLPQERPLASSQAGSSNPYDAYVGKYQLAPKLIVTITKDGNRLMSEVGGQSSELTPESDTQFTIPAANIKITFVKDATGQVTHILVNDNGREGRAKRIP